MSNKPDANTSDREANIVMQRTVDWHSKIEEIAGGPFPPGGNLTGWLEGVRRKIPGVSFWHVQQLYSGKLTNPKYDIAFEVLSAADRARIQEARSDGKKLAQIYQNLARVDENFHRFQIDAFVAALRDRSSSDSA